MKKHLSIIMSLIYFMFSGFSILLSQPSKEGADTELEYVAACGDRASINWTTKVIRVKGYGVGLEDVKDLGRRKLMAQRAAEMDAYRRLLEVVKGVRVTSYTNVEDMILASPLIRTKTTGMIKGMRVLKVTYTNDGGCRVTMEVNIDKDGKFLLTALNSGAIKITDNYPKFDWVNVLKKLEKTQKQLAHSQSELNKTTKDLREKEELLAKNQSVMPLRTDATPPLKPRNEYTGLLVDARKVGLKPALAPSILNPKQEKMYGIGVIPGKLVRGAIVSYMHGNIERAKKHKKIGDNPLVVECVKAVNKSDIMISNEDAQKLVLISNILGQKKVAILI